MPAAAIVRYDADCALCRASVAALLRWDRAGRLLPEAIQSPEGARLLAAVPPERRLAAAHVVTGDGRVRSGGDAVDPIARLLPGGAPVAWLARTLPAPTRAAYDWVARHRTGLGRLVPARAKQRAPARIAAHRTRVLAGRAVG
jgi:predicted DCC family thiol-disulfide oxidoreductase YuxK